MLTIDKVYEVRFVNKYWRGGLAGPPGPSIYLLMLFS